MVIHVRSESFIQKIKPILKPYQLDPINPQNEITNQYLYRSTIGLCIENNEIMYTEKEPTEIKKEIVNTVIDIFDIPKTNENEYDEKGNYKFTQYSYIFNRTNESWEGYEKGHFIVGYADLKNIIKSEDLKKLNKILEIDTNSTDSNYSNSDHSTATDSNYSNSDHSDSNSTDSNHSTDSNSTENEDSDSKPTKKSQVEKILNVINESGVNLEFFKDQRGQYFVRINYKRILPLESTNSADSQFGEYLTYLCDNSGTPFIPSKESLSIIIRRFRSWCAYGENGQDPKVYKLGVRCVRPVKFIEIPDPENPEKMKKRKIYTHHYDLINEDYSFVTIDPDKDLPYINNNENGEFDPMFIRYSMNSPQVSPIFNNDGEKTFHKFYDKLLENVKDPNTRILLKSYPIATLFSDDIIPILSIVNSNDCGKTTTIHLLVKKLIDPSTSDKLDFPTDIDLMGQIAQHSRVLFFDNNENYTKKQTQMGDKVVTGGSVIKRMLWTNDFDFSFDYRLAMITTSRYLPTDESDYIDRCLLIMDKFREFKKSDDDPNDPESKLKIYRTSETLLNEEFDNLLPELIGDALIIFHRSLIIKREMESGIIPIPTTLDKSHRMYDFIINCECICMAMGLESGVYSTAYNENILNRKFEELENSLIGHTLMYDFMENEREYIGTPTELHEEIGTCLKNRHTKMDRYPQTVNHFSRDFYKLVPLLKLKGFEVIITKEKNNRTIKIINHNLPIETSTRVATPITGKGTEVITTMKYDDDYKKRHSKQKKE